MGDISEMMLDGTLCEKCGTHIGDPVGYPRWCEDCQEAHAQEQFQQAKSGKVTCECGHTIPVRFAYRCLYCDRYFCQSCAEKHFGKTREQYWEENPQ